MRTQEQEEKEVAEADAEGGGEGEDEEERRRGEEEKKSLRVPQGACICRYLCGLTWGDDPQTRVPFLTEVHYTWPVFATGCPDLVGFWTPPSPRTL